MDYRIPRTYRLAKRVNDTIVILIGTYPSHEECERIRAENAAFHLERCPNDKLVYIVTPS